jgi:parallel beta-helix repeat protein
MRTLVAACSAAFVMILSLGLGRTAAAEPQTWIVDRDKVECAGAGFTSIQAAVNAANPGDVIRVCPDLYTESLVIDKPLTIRGQVDAVGAVDCLNPTPSQLADLDRTQHAILDGSGSTDLVLVTLAADGITFEGFVLQGASMAVLPPDLHLFRRAIDTSDQFAGYRITHNLLRLNTVGIQFGSAGGVESRVDHNCIRDNLWGLAADERTLKTARVDHNTTFRNTQIAFEPALGSVTDLRLDHNHSRQDGWSYLIQHSTDSRIEANTMESSRIGIVVGDANTGLAIGRNVITNPLGLNVQQGIAFRPVSSDAARNAAARVTDNQITGMSFDGIVTAPPSAAAPNGPISDSTFADNVTTGNVRDGMRFAGGFGNVVTGNVSLGNGRYGIYAVAATGNRFESNQMFGNGVFDARDDTGGANAWLANQCATDSPAGTICDTE